jgi:hypothetical protein
LLLRTVHGCRTQFRADTDRISGRKQARYVNSSPTEMKIPRKIIAPTFDLRPGAN